MNSLISANIRPLKFSNTKVEAVEMLGRMSEYLSSEILLDRVVPYMVNIQCYSNLTRPGHTHCYHFMAWSTLFLSNKGQLKIAYLVLTLIFTGILTSFDPKVT